jgi:hypothetical protein
MRRDDEKRCFVLNTTSISLLRALDGMAEVERARLAAQNATRDGEAIRPAGVMWSAKDAARGEVRTVDVASAPALLW